MGKSGGVDNAYKNFFASLPETIKTIEAIKAQLEGGGNF
jgi:hypothetical protein